MSEAGAPAQQPSRMARAFRALKDRRMAAMLILAFAASIPYGAIVGVLTAWLTEEKIDTDTIGVLSLVVLAVFTNPLTTGLAALSIFLYVCVYTPLKYKTPLALAIGAIPGAAPPLLGWTGITGNLDAGGLALFAILFVWQMPHFLAITIYRKNEMARAGIRCVSVVRGDANAKLQSILWSLLLVPAAVAPSFLGVAGGLYGITALVISLIFLGWSFTGLWAAKPARWARSFFLASLLYLPALIAALALDVSLGL